MMLLMMLLLDGGRPQRRLMLPTNGIDTRGHFRSKIARPSRECLRCNTLGHNVVMNPSVGMLTDRYELTMLAAALRDGTAQQPCVFEVFARRLPEGRRYGVVAGTARVLDTILSFGMDVEELQWLRDTRVLDEATAAFVRDYRFSGSVDGYPEGELFFDSSPILTVRATFAEAVLLETVVLSILNHDAAVAAAAARMVSAARERPIIEMGSRRTHEHAAMAAARAAYLAGFASTSNLAAGRAFAIPTAGTMAHAFILLHGDEEAAFRSQVSSFGAATTLLVDTYDITRGIERAVAAAGPQLAAIRIDSGDLGVLALQARLQLDALGNHNTKIVVSGDLDEYAIAGLAAAPVDVYGAGTAVVTGSGAPTAGLIYKLVEANGRPVAKRSENKITNGGAKIAFRAHRSSGTATDEILVTGSAESRARDIARLQRDYPDLRAMQQPLIRNGALTAAGAVTLDSSRSHLRDALRTLPWEGLSLSRGDAAIPTQLVTAAPG
jgi:nicotinate phosphoribosyltransferase